jgi:RNase P subunit RPR2
VLAITCDKCRRRYSVTDEELRVFLQEAEGKKFALVLCPHCGKGSKVPVDRINQALRFSLARGEPEEPASGPVA